MKTRKTVSGAALSITAAVAAVAGAAPAVAEANTDEASTVGVLASHLGPAGYQDDFAKWSNIVLKRRVTDGTIKHGWPVKYVAGTLDPSAFFSENNIQPPPTSGSE